MASRVDGKGFTLVEATVAIAVVAILAGMMAPMAVRTLNQQREAATRKALEQVFEGLFGSRDRRVGNMQADFGFAPEVGTSTLPVMVAKWGTMVWRRVPRFGLHAGCQFAWGYNGPYWHGDTSIGAPVDAWGSPIELICTKVERKSWQKGQEGEDDYLVQVRSRGSSKAKDGEGLVYPPSAVPLSSLRASVMVVVTRRDPSQAGTIALRYCSNGEVVDGKSLKTFALGTDPVTSAVFFAPAGGMQVEIESKGGTFPRRVIPMDLLPGETREVQVAL